MATFFGASIAWPDPARRRPLTDVGTVLSAFVPTLFCHSLAAVLVLLPGTRPLRIALVPVTLCLAYWCATSWVVSLSPGFNWLNYGFGLVHIALTMRVIQWTAPRTPIRRLSPTCAAPTSDAVAKHHVVNGHAANGHSNGDAKESQRARTGALLHDATNLTLNLRGLGWAWGRRCHVPEEWRRVSSRFAFAVDTLGLLVFDIFVFTASLNTIQRFRPPGANTLNPGWSIYNADLPVIPRYAQSSCIAFLTGCAVYGAMDGTYNAVTLTAMTLLRHAPTQWPPMFDMPWRSVSVAEFWSRRWHQIFRESFIQCGGRPGQAVAGRFGGVVGVFIVSGALHNLGMWMMGKGTDFLSQGGYFVAQALAISLETVWLGATRKPLSGIPARLWTFCAVVLPAHLLAEAWISRGLADSTFLPGM